MGWAGTVRLQSRYTASGRRLNAAFISSHDESWCIQKYTWYSYIGACIRLLQHMDMILFKILSGDSNNYTATILPRDCLT